MSRQSARTVAQGLGWFSIALGLAEVMAPRSFAHALGLRGRESVIQGYGLREIATGIGILSSRDPAPWIWGRVGGDAIDLATLATRFSTGYGEKTNLGVAAAAVAGVTALDVICALSLHQTSQAPSRRIARRTEHIFDYSDRSGFPAPPEAMRGAARDAIPDDMRAPKALRPWDDTDEESAESEARDSGLTSPRLAPV